MKVVLNDIPFIQIGTKKNNYRISLIRNFSQINIFLEMSYRYYCQPIYLFFFA